MTIELNQPAPDFQLSDQDGKLHKLADYRGKRVVLYFYPKDDTPGCTTEACSFRDNYSVFKQNDIEILGVSADSEKSHAKFQDMELNHKRLNLPIDKNMTSASIIRSSKFVPISTFAWRRKYNPAKMAKKPPKISVNAVDDRY